MIPFGGFMQSINGSAPGFGDKTTNTGKAVHGLPKNEDAILLSDDDARSFLEWVQKATNNTGTMATEGEGGFNFQPDDLESDLPALDQLQALIADAMGQSSADQTVSHPLDPESIDNGHVQFPQGIIAAIIAYNESRYSADNPIQESLIDVPEMMVAKGNPPEGGQARPGLSGIATQTGQTDVSQIKENTTATGQTQAVSKDQLFQTAISDSRTPTGTANESPIKENPLDSVMKGDKPEAGAEKGKTPFLLNPIVADGDEGKTNLNRVIQERLPSGMGTPEKSIKPATAQSQNIIGQTRDPESIAVAFTDQKTASSNEDMADSHGKGKHTLSPRAELADVNEEELQQGQSSDSVKSTVPEQSKSHASFQDTAKALSGDQSTNMALKSTTGQAAASARPEEPASKSFQTTVMDQIVDKAALRSIHGRSEIQIRLKPEFLGNVQMNIAADKEQLVVRIMTDRPMVKEIIETHLHHLKTELQSQGLTIDKFEVMVNPDANQQHSREQFAQMFKHHSSQNGQRQSPGKDPEALNRAGGNVVDDDPPNRDGVNYFA